ncbi:MAG: hypothetical protein JOY82_07700 [Streptosporangiaceae bacterium]|nr:hypothetical protein [Streptosporangiaceae bacterium]
MPNVDEMDQYGMLKSDWGELYAIARVPGETRPYRAQRRDDPDTVLEADTPAGLRELIRDDHTARGSAATSQGGAP